MNSFFCSVGKDLADKIDPAPNLLLDGDYEVNTRLSPILFLIYINDLPQAVQDSTVSLYADDTSFCYQSHHLTLLNEAINSDLKELDTWLQGNKLSLNVAKTHSMLISTKQKQNSLKSEK